MENLHNIKAYNVGDVGRSIPRIYVSLDGRQVVHKFRRIEVVGKISNVPISILSDYGASHSY